MKKSNWWAECPRCGETLRAVGAPCPYCDCDEGTAQEQFLVAPKGGVVVRTDMSCPDDLPLGEVLLLDIAPMLRLKYWAVYVEVGHKQYKKVLGSEDYPDEISFD